MKPEQCKGCGAKVGDWHGNGCPKVGQAEEIFRSTEDRLKEAEQVFISAIDAASDAAKEESPEGLERLDVLWHRLGILTDRAEARTRIGLYKTNRTKPDLSRLPAHITQAFSDAARVEQEEREDGDPPPPSPELIVQAKYLILAVLDITEWLTDVEVAIEFISPLGIEVRWTRPGDVAEFRTVTWIVQPHRLFSWPGVSVRTYIREDPTHPFALTAHQHHLAWVVANQTKITLMGGRTAGPVVY